LETWLRGAKYEALGVLSATLTLPLYSVNAKRNAWNGFTVDEDIDFT